MGASFCMYLFVCKVISVQKRLCRKAPVLKKVVCRSVHMQKFLCMGVKISVLKNMLYIKIRATPGFCPGVAAYICPIHE